MFHYVPDVKIGDGGADDDDDDDDEDDGPPANHKYVKHHDTKHQTPMVFYQKVRVVHQFPSTRPLLEVNNQIQQDQIQHMNLMEL